MQVLQALRSPASVLLCRKASVVVELEVSCCRQGLGIPCLAEAEVIATRASYPDMDSWLDYVRNERLRDKTRLNRLLQKTQPILHALQNSRGRTTLASFKHMLRPDSTLSARSSTFRYVLLQSRNRAAV